ncbi:MAG: hypothetical protein ACXAEF_13380 [Candidatus Thorarchaeota archaeon]|jgi:hypothetical protein
MNRKNALKNLLIILGAIILFLTLVEYLDLVLSLTPIPVLSYWFQIIYLVSIMLFLILLAIYIEVRMRSVSVES